MKVTVFMANGCGNKAPKYEDFKELYFRTVEKDRNQLTEEGITKVAWNVLNCLIQPLVKATGLCIKEREFYWSPDSHTHEVGYIRFDFEREDKLWVMVVLR